MFIALDARTIYPPGQGRTAENLIDMYGALAQIRPDWQVLAYHRQPEATEGASALPSARSVYMEMGGNRVDAWGRWRLPLAASRAGASVLHCPANLCPSWMPLPTVVTIHDLMALDFPAERSPAQVRRFDRSIRTACRHAAHIVCPSRYTRDRLMERFGADPHRITVNYWAPSRSIQPLSTAQNDALLIQCDLARPFVLHLGGTELRKNTRRVIEAWSMIDPALRQEWRLVVVGLNAKARSEFERHARRCGTLKSVRWFDFVDEDQFNALLGSAQALVYPSLSEEFGRPVLDAWAAGTAVLTSNTASLKELAGKAAMTVDPTDVCAVADGLWALMKDEQTRANLVGRGGRRVREFSWSQTAERFADVIERVVSSADASRQAA